MLFLIKEMDPARRITLTGPYSFQERNIIVLPNKMEYFTVIALAASSKPMHFHFLKKEAEREGQESFESRMREMGRKNGSLRATEEMLISLKVRGVWGYRNVDFYNPNFVE